MDNIITCQIECPKTVDFGPKQGGFNVLNVPNSMYKTPEQFWKEVNRPWLDAAVKRGDDIYLATRPEEKLLNRVTANGRIERSGFGREYDYLISYGYKYEISTGKMIRGEK